MDPFKSIQQVLLNFTVETVQQYYYQVLSKNPGRLSKSGLFPYVVVYFLCCLQTFDGSSPGKSIATQFSLEDSGGLVEPIESRFSTSTVPLTTYKERASVSCMQMKMILLANDSITEPESIRSAVDIRFVRDKCSSRSCLQDSSESPIVG